jgi:hypothetical protein
MKNKKNTYFLLLFVLIVWGAVLYQFFSFSNAPVEEINRVEIDLKPLQIKQRDTFSITINRRDPFLGKMAFSSQIKKINTNSKSTITNTKKLKEVLIWPDIKYKGIVSDSKEKIKVYMVIIDGKTFFMKKGEIESEVKLKEGDRDAIYPVYKGELKAVFIQ